MYSVIFLKGNRTVLENEFISQKEAEDFVSEQVSDHPYEYQIFDKAKNILVAEGELDYENGREDGSLDVMFPDEESTEGFDVDDFFEME